MPVYEYECSRCGGRIEEIQKFSDAPLAKHGGCGGRLKRLLSAPAIQFKGTGFYITDYARKSGFSSDQDPKTEKKEKKDAGAEVKADSKAGSENGPSTGKPEKTSKPAKKTT